MKKHFLCVTVSIVMILCLLSGCGSKKESGPAAGGKDERVDIALKEIDRYWDDYQIKNTRIVVLKENDEEYFDGIEYIVEFLMYTDYFGSAPYYSYFGQYDSVSVFEDGHAEINPLNPFNVYRSKTFNSDFSGFIGEIVDLGAAYNN